MANDWRIPQEPPSGATPLAPASIRENVQEGEIVSTPVVEKVPETGEFKGLPVRVAGDKIWLLKNGKRAWVTSKEVYEKLGFKFGDEKNIDFETLMALPEAEPIR